MVFHRKFDIDSERIYISRCRDPLADTRGVKLVCYKKGKDATVIGSSFQFFVLIPMRSLC